MSFAIIRGTTPTFKFKMPVDVSTITTLNIAYSQKDNVILEKALSDVNINGNTLSVTLTETETLMFKARVKLELQLRWCCGTSKMASQIMSGAVKRILKEGCLE